jgi:hypothetical protein
MDPSAAASLWEELVAPWQAKGSLLGSPAPGSTCVSPPRYFLSALTKVSRNLSSDAEQAGETWLSEFQGNITTMWDFTAAHIYQSDVDGVQTVIVCSSLPVSSLRPISHRTPSFLAFRPFSDSLSPRR